MKSIRISFQLTDRDIIWQKELTRRISGIRTEGQSVFPRGKTEIQTVCRSDGWQLYRWYQSRKFCGHCGQPMVHDDKERMMRCPDCGMMEFPKICPAVIIAVTHGDKILMSKYAGREYKSMHCLQDLMKQANPLKRR